MFWIIGALLPPTRGAEPIRVERRRWRYRIRGIVTSAGSCPLRKRARTPVGIYPKLFDRVCRRDLAAGLREEPAHPLRPVAEEIASRTARASRSGVKGARGGRRTPARAISARLAVSSWSRPKGTTTTGTPAARAFWAIPIPPWHTTHATPF